MFVRLGLVNSFRQLGRSLLVLLAVMLAAMSMTSALSFSQGEMKNSYQFYRELLGGEILVSPVRWAGQQLDDVTGQARLQYRRLNWTGLSWLETYYPELYRDGFFSSPSQADSLSLRQQDLDQLLGQPNIAGYSLHPQLQVELRNSSRLSDQYITYTVLPLPDSGRLPGTTADWTDLNSSAEPLALINVRMNVPDELVAAAAATIPDAAVVSNDEEIRPTPEQVYQRKLVAARNQVLQELKLPKAGEWAELTLPSYRCNQSGDCVPDYVSTSTVQVRVQAQTAIPTRTLAWLDSMGSMASETAYLHGAYLWVSSATWDQLWQQAAGEINPPLENVSLQVDDMDQLDATIKQLQAAFPQYTFVGVNTFAQRIESLSLIDRFYRAPSYLYHPAESGNLAVPVQLGPVFGVLFFLIAGMLIASRMLTGAAARRLEIGILKALGARRRDITLMVLTEVLLLTLLGVCLGFVLVRAGGVIREIGNQVPVGQVVRRTLIEFGQVSGLATAVSLLFAVLPALRLSNLTVMGVLRGE